MRRTAVLFMVMVVCGGTLATAQGQETQNQSASSSRECVVVIGAVMVPGRFELKRPTKLFEVLAFAGGLKKNAGATVQVMSTDTQCAQETPDPKVPASTPKTHTYQTEDLIGHTKPPNEEALNRYVAAGDIVVVSEAESAYIIGAVLQPQAIVLRSPVTLTQAIQMAGGLKKEAKVEKVRIIRELSDSTKQEIVVNFKDIRKKKAADLVLQPNDIVEVPGGRPHGPMFSIPGDVPGLKPPADRVIAGWRSER